MTPIPPPQPTPLRRPGRGQGVPAQNRQTDCGRRESPGDRPLRGLRPRLRERRPGTCMRSSAACPWRGRGASDALPAPQLQPGTLRLRGVSASRARRAARSTVPGVVEAVGGPPCHGAARLQRERATLLPVPPKSFSVEHLGLDLGRRQAREAQLLQGPTFDPEIAFEQDVSKLHDRCHGRRGHPHGRAEG